MKKVFAFSKITKLLFLALVCKTISNHVLIRRCFKLEQDFIKYPTGRILLTLQVPL